MKEKIKSILAGLGADVCGVANIDRFAECPEGFSPADIYPDCKSVIVFGKVLSQGLAHVSPRLVYHNANNINLAELDRIGFLASVELEKLGVTVVPVPSDDPYEYWDKDKLEGRGLMSIKHAAVNAGLGCIGKSTLLLNKDYGCMMNLGAVLTNMNLESDPLAEDICIKDCRICLETCPPEALNGVTVDQKLCRIHTFSNNEKGYSVCNCNSCRVQCPMAFGEV